MRREGEVRIFGRTGREREGEGKEKERERVWAEQTGIEKEELIKIQIP